jgi:toxin ParE1/3/4
LDAVEQTLHAIAEAPDSGHRYLNAMRPEDDWRYLRVGGFKKYFVFYRITEARVEVVRIVHGSRDLDTILRVL